jgi:S1-C subfamily serine protease
MVKKWIIGVVAAVALLAGCASVSKNTYQADFPIEVTDWLAQNVWYVQLQNGSGSGFWVSPTTFVTACHVVDRAEEVYIMNDTIDEIVGMDVESCNKELDIAILHPNWDTNQTVNYTYLNTQAPRVGKAVYAAGYALGRGLLISQGHYAGATPGGAIVTANTIMGDSGSPVVIWKNGQVRIIGMRVAIANLRSGFFRAAQVLPHMTKIVPSSWILDELHGK